MRQLNPRWSLLLIAVTFLSQLVTSHSRVVDIGDDFLKREADQAFLVKFYAPWCGHCRSMEPAYKEVAERLLDSSVIVGRIDATAHQLVASQFRIRGFPTVMFIKGDKSFEYRGERTADEMVKFVNRVGGDPVKTLASPGKFNEALQASSTEPFFLFLGDKGADEFSAYSYVAQQMRTDASFYRADADLLDRAGFDPVGRRLDGGGDFAGPVGSPRVLVFKDMGCVPYLGKLDNDSFGVWANNEKYLVYPQVGDFLFYTFYPITKLMVVLIGNWSDEFVQIGRRLAFSGDSRLANAQLAWTNTAKAASELAMAALPTPNIIMMNPNTSQYYLRGEYNTPANAETEESIKKLIIDCTAGKLRAYGGSGVLEGLKRTVYDFVTGLAAFVIEHPGLALVVIGAPIGVVGILCYAICCMDTSDDENELVEEEEEEEGEEEEGKKEAVKGKGDADETPTESKKDQ